jgi:hypothetical protein
MYSPFDGLMICYNRMPVDVYVKKTVECVGGEELYKRIGYLVSYLYSYTSPQVFVPTKYS